MVPRIDFPLSVRTMLVLSMFTATVMQAAETHEPVLTADDIFDRSRLLQVDIEIEQANWDILRTQTRSFATALMKPAPPSPYTWVKAKRVTINGQTIDDVAIRKKGFIGSQDATRPSLKIKFDEYKDQDPIEGVNRITLNNNKQDTGFVSQTLAYKLFADAQLPASRCSLARVTVNGKPLGIYSNVESVKKPMLMRNFEDNTGKLYEGTVTDFRVGHVDAFEAKTTDDDDKREELAALAELLAEEGDLDMPAIEKVLDVDQFLRFWAMESLIGFWDGYSNNQNNYFVYYHALDSKFHFMPWGVDAAFSYEGPAKMFKKGPESVNGQAFAANRLYNTTGVPDRYKQTLESLLDEVWNEEEILAEIDRIEGLVKGHTHEDQENYVDAMNDAREFVETRRKRLTRELNKWPQRIAKKPRNPFYTARVGKAKGKFKTKWLDKKPTDPYELGEAELELTLNGKPVEFLRLGVHAIQSDDRDMSGKKPPTVVFIGKRKSNKIKVTLGIGTDAENFTAATGKSIPAQGVLVEGAWFVGGFKMVGGKMTLDEAGMEPGDTVRGTLELDVVQFKGDMR